MGLEFSDRTFWLEPGAVAPEGPGRATGPLAPAGYANAAHRRGSGQRRRTGSNTKRTALPGRPPVVRAKSYWTRLMRLNIGMYSATTMPPTANPITTIRRGSISDVSASTVASTSWS